jgi:diaminohydroxyphosphoribosylaminopyrimidine deaminase/5-amino-6-(5-phosphoribosylamino)uracil reductase
MSPSLNLSDRDAFFMARALKLAEKGLYTTDPNPRVGCVIVKQDRILGEGWHHRSGGPHAEVEALAQVQGSARGATAYVTLEPCCHHGKTPPCSASLIQAGISRVVCATEDPNPLVAGKGLKQLQDAGIEVMSGLMRDSTEALNPGFFKRMRSGLPFIRSKLAMSLDGRTAMASGESQWITGEDARRDVHHLRARSSAIMTGIGTVLADKPRLTVRLDDLQEYTPPLRVILDRRLETPRDTPLVQDGLKTLIITDQSPEASWSQMKQVEFLKLPSEISKTDRMLFIFHHLAERGINEILVEAGSKLNGVLLSENWVDEWILYMAPKILGDQGKGLFHLPHLSALSEAPELQLTQHQVIGADQKMTFTRRSDVHRHH